MSTTPMTLLGKKQIEEELEFLIKSERELIKRQLAEARELGDLKENAEFHAAKEKQSQVEGRILELQGKINTAVVVDISKLKTEKVVFGATVTLYDTKKEKSVVLQIVGSDEARVDGKISYDSPLGKALIGKEEGDTVLFRAPKGNVEYEIESIKYV